MKFEVRVKLQTQAGIHIAGVLALVLRAVSTVGAIGLSKSAELGVCGIAGPIG